MLVEFSFELADLSAGAAVMLDERQEPAQSMGAGEDGGRGQIELLEVPQAGFDLADCLELLPDLDGQFGDLILNVVRERGAHGRQAMRLFRLLWRLTYRPRDW